MSLPLFRPGPMAGFDALALDRSIGATLEAVEALEAMSAGSTEWCSKALVECAARLDELAQGSFPEYADYDPELAAALTCSLAFSAYRPDLAGVLALVTDLRSMADGHGPIAPREGFDVREALGRVRLSVCGSGRSGR